MNVWELVVIPEDGNLQDAVNGFREGLEGLQSGRWRLIKVSSRKHAGWRGAVDELRNQNLPRFPKRHVLLVIDLDHDDAGGREREIDEKLNSLGLLAFRNRIHILVVWRHSEDLRNIGGDWGKIRPQKPNDYKSIGECLARTCLAGDATVWDNSPVLSANREERQRMRETVCKNLTLSMGKEDKIRA